MIAPRPSRGLVCLWMLLLAHHVGCQSNTDSPVVTSSEESAAFHDAADETGLQFQHDNGMTGRRYMPEMVGAGCALFDYDRDGRLDLVVCRYLLWDYAVHHNCSSPGGQIDYCGPHAFKPARSRLFHNGGDGRFDDVSRASRISSLAGAALGVVCADVDEDGWPDLFISNDGMDNHLWMNRKDGTFEEEAAVRGCAVNAEGKPEASMGVIAADFRNVGRIDLFITHLKSEHSTYYENLNDGIFADVTARLALDGTTRPFTGFGTGALDYDNDGWLDLFATNGEVRTNDAQAQAGIKMPLRQRSMLFHNRGGDSIRFEEIRAGKFLQVEDVGRGAAFGDLDQDGDLDIVVTNNAGPTRLLINNVGQDQHWLGLRLVDGPADAGRDVLGAIVRVERPDAPILQRRSATDGSYLSSSDPRTLFGLGQYSQATRVAVKWPDGREEVWRDLVVDQYHDLARGSGIAEDTASSSPQLNSGI